MKTDVKTTNQIGRMALLWSCLAIIAVLMQWSVSAQTLVNRYSFTDDGTGTNVVDSVGGTAWYGTMPNGGDFASLPGQLLLSASSQQYVQLPVGILSNYTAVTIDCWATFGTLPVQNGSSGGCFLYGFGDTDTNGAGYDYIFEQPQQGRIAISGADPGWQGEQATGGASDFSGQTIHVTSVYNPPAGYIELYTNGVLVSRNTTVTTPMSAVTNQLNYIARSLYSGDSYIDVALNEFRIWNGALNPLQVAGSDVGGADTVSTDPGTITSIQLQMPYYQLVQGGNEAATVSATASSFSSVIDITRLSTYTSAKTNILTVNTNGTINAVGQGSANIIASYASLTSTQLITVVQPASALAHRYSFSEANGSTTVADSINPGGAWDGTVMSNGLNGVVAPGNFTGSQLILTAGTSNYVQFPAGIISNYLAVTIEAWATFPTALPGACFLWAFGDTDPLVLSGGKPSGFDYIYLQPSGGIIGIGGNDPGWSGEQQAGTFGNLSLKSNLHITAVFNPQANWMAVYTNGILAGKNTAVTWQMNQVRSVLNYIARSLYGADSYMDVNIDEYRIYNGALTSQGVAISDAAGPDSVPAAVTNGPGNLLSLSIQAPSTLVAPLYTGTVKLLANYQNLTNWDIINNSIFTPAGLTVSTSNTNILVYGSDGLLHGVNPGTASVVVVYQGTTNTASVTVVGTLSPTLTHRYSFNDANGSTNVADSVGGAAWAGTVMSNGTNAVPAPGAITNGVLYLSTANTNYVQLPSGILSNYTTVSIEMWVTFPGSLPGNCCIFDFGNTDGTGAGEDYIFCQPLNGRVCISTNDAGWQGTGEQNAWSSGVANVNWSWANKSNLHVVAVVNPPAGYIAIYTNGVLAGINTGETMPLSGVSSALNYIGRSLYNGDSYLSANIDEFRIYNGVMSPFDVKATQVLGPNYPLSPNLGATVGGGNVTLSWPTNYASPTFTLQSRTNLISGTWQTEGSPTIVGSQFQVTVPNSGGAKFFRLAR